MSPEIDMLTKEIEDMLYRSKKSDNSKFNNSPCNYLNNNRQ